MTTMTLNEKIEKALAPIIDKMREHGASDREAQAYSNGFRIGAMWATTSAVDNEIKRVEAITRGGGEQKTLGL